METFRREIFEQLGNVFYAIAVAQQISPLSFGELKMLLRKDWLGGQGQPTEDKVSESAHMIGLTIDSLQTAQTNAAKAYASFESFFWKHEEQFSFALKQNILETANALLKLFPSTEKKNVYADSLKGLLQKSMQGTKAR